MLDRLANRRRLTARGALVAAIAATALVAPWSIVHAEGAAVPLSDYLDPLALQGASSPKTTLWAYPTGKQKEAKKASSDKIVNTKYAVKHVDAYGLAKQLGKEFPSPSIQILVDPRSNCVFVMAKTNDTGKILKRIAQIDKPSAAPTMPLLDPAKTTTFRLAHWRADSLIEHLIREYRSQNVKFVLDARANSILVQADQGTTARIRKSIEDYEMKAPVLPSTSEAGEPAKKGSTQQTFRVFNISAAQLMVGLNKEAIKARLELMFCDQLDQNITLRGPEAEVKRIGAMIVESDVKAGQKPLDQLTLRRYTLQYTSAKDICEILQRDWGKRLNFLSYDPVDNTIVARTTVEQVEKLSEYIRRLDVIPPTN